MKLIRECGASGFLFDLLDLDQDLDASEFVGQCLVLTVHLGLLNDGLEVFCIFASILDSLLDIC